MFVCNILNSSHLNHLNQGKHFNLMSITILCQNYKKKSNKMTVKVTVVTQACYLFDFAFLIW